MNDKPYKLCICGNPTALHSHQCARCGLRFTTGAFFEPSGKNNPQNTMIIPDGVIEFDSTKEKK